ncbi:hypothetical protein RHOFW510R12_00465 [Rhodanobacter sp. FW510-R12]|uniref:hypothetical protein n=1 Tax=Rhodanobacter thiooxydans TaxID=416169 RepID=UPI000910D08C|nr:hypothetical protein [Rhodanobacter thiooxydans]UJJ56714.1 hypothetical protein LRK53_19080 [Rhodanobacter thiooxydans]
MPVLPAAILPLVPRWQAEQARVDPEHWFAEYKFMQDEIDELRDQLDLALAPIEQAARFDAWETLGPIGEWVAITEAEFNLLRAHGVGRQQRRVMQSPPDPDGAMPLARAMAMADLVSPSPSAASAALRTLRARIIELEAVASGTGAAAERRQ